MSELYQDLLETVAQGRAVIVAGAGVSIAATRGAACASWVGLLQDGVSRCADVTDVSEDWVSIARQELGSRSIDLLLSVAEKVSTRLGAPSSGEWARWLQDTVGSLTAADERLILSLDFLEAPILTTNYDGIIESVTGRDAITWMQPSEIDKVLRGDSDAIVHLHGHVAQPSSIILGLRSYERILGDHHIRGVLHSLAASRSLVFVGFGQGIGDPNFEALTQWVADAFAGSPYRHFKLVEGAEPRLPPTSPRDRIFEVAFGEFDVLPDFLTQLRRPVVTPKLPNGSSRKAFIYWPEREIEWSPTDVVVGCLAAEGFNVSSVADISVTADYELELEIQLELADLLVIGMDARRGVMVPPSIIQGRERTAMVVAERGALTPGLERIDAIIYVDSPAGRRRLARELPEKLSLVGQRQWLIEANEDLGQGQFDRATQLAVGELYRCLRELAEKQLSRQYFRKRSVENYSLGGLFKLLISKDAIRLTDSEGAIDWRFLRETRNFSAHGREIRPKRAERFVRDVSRLIELNSS